MDQCLSDRAQVIEARTIESEDFLLGRGEVRIQTCDLVVARLVTGGVECVRNAIVILEQTKVLRL